MLLGSGKVKALDVEQDRHEVDFEKSNDRAVQNDKTFGLDLGYCDQDADQHICGIVDEEFDTFLIFHIPKHVKKLFP